MEQDYQSGGAARPSPTQGILDTAKPKNNKSDAAKRRNYTPCAACQRRRQGCDRGPSGPCKRCKHREEECTPGTPGKKCRRRGDDNFINQSGEDYSRQRPQRESRGSRIPEMRSPAASRQQSPPQAVDFNEGFYSFSRQNTGVRETLGEHTTLRSQGGAFAEHSLPDEASGPFQGNSTDSVELRETFIQNIHGNYDMGFAEVHANSYPTANPGSQVDHVQTTSYDTILFPSQTYDIVTQENPFTMTPLSLEELLAMETFDGVTYDELQDYMQYVYEHPEILLQYN